MQLSGQIFEYYGSFCELQLGPEDFFSNKNLIDLEDAQLRIILVDQLELFQLIKIEAPELAWHIYQNAQPIFKKTWELKSN